MKNSIQGKSTGTEPMWRNRWLRRFFRVCTFDESRKIGFWRRIIDHTVAGGIIGFLVLHPLSMIAHDFFHLKSENILHALGMSFSYAHLSMTVFFVIVGSLFGLIHGSYIHIISKLHEEIRLLAISDELTGLFNRRFFTTRLEQEVACAQRYGHPLSLLMLDIDSFKCFNDTHGHPAGDELLRQMGDLLGEMIRESDFAARYGGEEFVVVMPETDGGMGHCLAGRICAAVSDYPFRYRESQPGGRVTISIGIAELPTDAPDTGQLIKRADEALYAAKADGKNRVCKFDPGYCRAEKWTGALS